MGAVLCVKLDKIIMNLRPGNYTHFMNPGSATVSVCSISSDTHVLKKCQPSPAHPSPEPTAALGATGHAPRACPQDAASHEKPAVQEQQPPLARVAESVPSPKLQSHLTAQTEKEPTFSFTFCSFSPGPNVVTADKPLIYCTREPCGSPQDPKVPGRHHPASRGTGRSRSLVELPGPNP